jgi:hypothetical protein
MLSPVQIPAVLAVQFFQQSQKQDNQNDMINFAMIAIAMWAVYKGFSTVIQL